MADHKLCTDAFPLRQAFCRGGRSLVLTRLPCVPPMWLLIWPRDTAFPHLASPPAHRLLEGSVHAYSSPWVPPGPAEWTLVDVHAFPFSLLTCQFSNFHFHLGVFTSAVIGMNKNSDCWQSSFQTPYNLLSHLILASTPPGIVILIL